MFLVVLWDLIQQVGETKQKLHADDFEAMERKSELHAM